MPLEEKGGSNQIKRVLASECSSCGLVQTPPQTEPIFQKYPPENFQRPARCRGGAISEGPLYPLNEFEAVIRSRWVEFVP